jgi:hypothetical protein
MNKESESEKLARNINEGMETFGDAFVSVAKWLFFGAIIFIPIIVIICMKESIRRIRFLFPPTTKNRSAKARRQVSLVTKPSNGYCTMN